MRHLAGNWGGLLYFSTPEDRVFLGGDRLVLGAILVPARFVAMGGRTSGTALPVSIGIATAHGAGNRGAGWKHRQRPPKLVRAL